MKEEKIVVYTSVFLEKKIQYLILFFTIIILYVKTIGYDYNLDDFIITDTLDGKVNSLNDLFQLFKLSYNNADYRPIVFLSFGIEKLLFGSFSTTVSHAINCVLYFLISVSALKLFSVLFGKENNILLFFAVLLFCVLPINTEVVCSIKCRDNLLSMLFALNSSIFFIKYIDEKNNKYYLLIAGFFSLIAILSKRDAFGFCLLNFSYIIFWKKEKIRFYILSIFILFFMVFIINYLLTYNLMTKNLTTPLTPKISFTENPLALVFTIPNRIVALFNTLYYYFSKLTYISSSKYYYGYNYYNILSTRSISFYIGILIFAALTFGFIYALINKNKMLLFSVIGIVVCGVYAFNFFVPVAGIIADRYIFMSSLFFCLLVIYLLNLAIKFFKFEQYSAHIIIAIIVCYAVISFIRINAWQNFRTLINTDAPALYTSYEAMRIASSEYYEEYKKTEQPTDLEQAIFYGEKGNAVYPKNAILHLLSGQFYFKKADYKNAILQFKKVINNDSTLSEPLVYLGDTYYASKNMDSALVFYQKALNKVPKNPELINNISTVYFEKGDKEKCLQFNYDLIKTDSTTYAAYENLGYYYLTEKDTTKAISYFKQGERYGLKPVDIKNLP